MVRGWLKHFPEKWSPVFRKKMRPLNKARVLSGSFEPESTLADFAPEMTQFAMAWPGAVQ
jgi:hypothetical protein